MLTILSISSRGDVLEKVCEYLLYWFRYQDKEDVPDMDIPVHMCLELLTAADFLGIDCKFLATPGISRLAVPLPPTWSLTAVTVETR